MTGDPIPMNQLMTPPASVQPQPPTRDREGTVMLLHEALARCRQQEAEQAAREYANSFAVFLVPGPKNHRLAPHGCF